MNTASVVKTLSESRWSGLFKYKVKASGIFFNLIKQSASAQILHNLLNYQFYSFALFLNSSSDFYLPSNNLSILSITLCRNSFFTYSIGKSFYTLPYNTQLISKREVGDCLNISIYFVRLLIMWLILKLKGQVANTFTENAWEY